MIVVFAPKAERSLNIAQRANCLGLTLLSIAILVNAPGCQTEKKAPNRGQSEQPRTIDAAPSDTGLGLNVNPANSEIELVGIVVNPTNQLVEMDLGVPEQLQLTATAVYSNGEEQEVTALADWQFQSPELATFEGSSLNISARPALGTQTALARATFEGLEGFAQITVVAFQKSGEQPDFFFSLPYQPPGEVDTNGEEFELGDLKFQTKVPNLDVFFNMDTTGSMGGFVDVLQDKLTSTIFPGIQAKIPDSWFGVGTYQDFPISSYGAATDRPFDLKQEMTGDLDEAESAVDAIVLKNGGDLPESLLESLYQIASGEGLTRSDGTELVARNTTGKGGVGFRSQGMSTIFSMTDIGMHTIDEDASTNPSRGTDYNNAEVLEIAHSRTQTIAELNQRCVKSLGAATARASLSGLEDLEAMAEATGAVVPPQAWGSDGERPANCANGQCCTSPNGGREPNANGLCPLAYEVTAQGDGLDDSVVNGFDMLTRFSPFDVVTKVKDDIEQSIDGEPLPTGKTTASFIKGVDPVSFEVPAEPSWLEEPEIDLERGRFLGVNPGTNVQFKISVKNDFIEPTSYGRFFQTRISVLAGDGGCAELDARDVLILVPPEEIEPSVTIIK